MAWRKSGFLRVLKNKLVPEGVAPRTILTGAFRGIRMELNLRTDSQLYVGLFERELYPVLKRLSRGIQSAVDIGAANGEYTLYILMKTGMKRLIAFEPDLSFTDRLHRNMGLNGLKASPRFELHTKFLGPEERPDTIAADTLSEWITAPCLIKMDIEGGELAVLRASKNLLAVPGLRWLIEVHSKAIRQECISILESCGYTATYIPQARWRVLLPELRGTEVGWLVATKE
jgi:hypothetical protein